MKAYTDKKTTVMLVFIKRCSDLFLQAKQFSTSTATGKKSFPKLKNFPPVLT